MQLKNNSYLVGFKMDTELILQFLNQILINLF